jgi:hypothetical protein
MKSTRRTIMTNTPIHITLSGQLSSCVDSATWAKIKAYMTYQDQDFLDDMDVFDVEPGWYVTNVEAVERILGVPDEWKVAPRRIKARQEAEAAEERKARETKERSERIKQKTATYAEWKEQHLAGLESFHDWFEGFPKLDWQQVATFDEEAGWYNTGDRWSTSTWKGDIIYSVEYGNTTAYYTTRANAVKLARAGIAWQRKFYPTDVDMARHILMTHDRNTIGDDSARIVVEEDGLQPYIDIAKQETWYIIARSHAIDDFWQTADKYGLPYVELTRSKSTYDRSVTDKKRETFEKRLKDYFQVPYIRYSQVHYLPEEDKWFVDEGHTRAEAVLAPDLSDLFPELMK